MNDDNVIYRFLENFSAEIKLYNSNRGRRIDIINLVIDS
jgi:hypothetical protein